MRITKEGLKLTQEFDDVAEYLSYVKQPVQSSMRNDSDDRGNDFLAGGSLENAYRLAEEGWPDGLKAVRKFDSQINDRLVGYLKEPELHYDVTGDFLDVGRFVNGEPETFGGFVETEVDVDSVTPKIVHIVANLTVSGSVSHEIMEMRGAALVALIDALESHGKRAEVDVIANNHGGNGEVFTKLRVKDAQHPLQMDKLAFLLVHPVAFRRLWFRCFEQSPDDIRRTIGGAYGYPKDPDENERGDVYLPSLKSYGESDWSFDRTLEWVLTTLEQCGVTVTPNEEERATLKGGVA